MKFFIELFGMIFVIISSSICLSLYNKPVKINNNIVCKAAIVPLSDNDDESVKDLIGNLCSDYYNEEFENRLENHKIKNQMSYISNSEKIIIKFTNLGRLNSKNIVNKINKNELFILFINTLQGSELSDISDDKVALIKHLKRNYKDFLFVENKDIRQIQYNKQDINKFINIHKINKNNVIIIDEQIKFKIDNLRTSIGELAIKIKINN